MRLFVAAYPPPEVREHLAKVVAGLVVGQPRERGQSVRLAPAEQWHVTLGFLGDVPDARLGDAQDAVGAAAGVDIAPPVIRVGGGGTFGRGRFTVLWAGLGGDLDGLRALAKGVRRELRGARLPFDAKPLRPHLTIARPGDRLSPEQLAGDLAVLAGYEGPEWTIGTIRLMRSHLGPRPTYDTMLEATLKPSP